MKDHDSDHSAPPSFIKTPQQLIVVIVLAFVIPVIGIILLANFATGGSPFEQATNPEAVAERIAPVAQVAVGQAPAFKPNELSAAAPAAPAAASGDKGQSVYQTACGACHGTGAAGAPKLGDKGQWAARLSAGKDHLYQSALNGKGAMPPKGGFANLSDADVKAAVDYMVNAAK